MKVVIVGSRIRDEVKDRPLIDAIINSVQRRYGKYIIITKSGSKSVGKLIYERCTSQGPDKVEFDLMEYSLRHTLQYELPRSEFLKHFDTLNAPLVELGDEFHILAAHSNDQSTRDIIERVREAGLPYALYTDDDPIKAKVPQVGGASEDVNKETK